MYSIQYILFFLLWLNVDDYYTCLCFCLLSKVLFVLLIVFEDDDHSDNVLVFKREYYYM